MAIRDIAFGEMAFEKLVWENRFRILVLGKIDIRGKNWGQRIPIARFDFGIFGRYHCDCHFLYNYTYCVCKIEF